MDGGCYRRYSWASGASTLFDGESTGGDGVRDLEAGSQLTLSVMNLKHGFGNLLPVFEILASFSFLRRDHSL